MSGGRHTSHLASIFVTAAGAADRGLCSGGAKSPRVNVLLVATRVMVV